MSSPPVLPADGATNWGNGTGKWATDSQARLAGNGAAADPTVRSLGTGASEAAAGNHTHTIPDANETTKGIAEVATATETSTGTDDTRMVTPLKLKTLLDLKADAALTTTTQSGTTHTLALVNAGTDIEYTNAAGCAVTIPLNATVAFPIGTIITLYQRGAAQVVVGGPGAGAGGGTAGSVTVESRGSVFKTAGLNAPMSLKKRATDGWIVSGDISS